IGVTEIARCVYKTKDAVQVRGAPALEQAGIGPHRGSNLMPPLTHAVGLYPIHFRPGDELLAFEGLHAFPDHDKRFAGHGLAGLPSQDFSIWRFFQLNLWVVRISIHLSRRTQYLISGPIFGASQAI